MPGKGDRQQNVTLIGANTATGATTRVAPTTEADIRHGLVAIIESGLAVVHETGSGVRSLDMTSHSTPLVVTYGQRGPLFYWFRKMKLLTVSEVAETMKVSEKTVRRLIKRGDLPAYRLGERGQLRIEEGELERYVLSQRVRPNEVLKPQQPVEQSE